MKNERNCPPYFKGRGQYQSYFLPYEVHLKEVRNHNENQLKSAKNEQAIIDMKLGRVSRRAVRREALAQNMMA